MIHESTQEAGGILMAGIASRIGRYSGNSTISRNMRTCSPVRAGFRGAFKGDSTTAIVASGCAQMISYHCIGSQIRVTYCHEEAARGVNLVSVAIVARLINGSRHHVPCRFAQGDDAIMAVRTRSSWNSNVVVCGGGNEAGYTAMASHAVLRDWNGM